MLLKREKCLLYKKNFYMLQNSSEIYVGFCEREYIIFKKKLLAEPIYNYLRSNNQSFGSGSDLKNLQPHSFFLLNFLLVKIGEKEPL